VKSFEFINDRTCLSDRWPKLAAKGPESNRKAPITIDLFRSSDGDATSANSKTKSFWEINFYRPTATSKL
jgi:hypothetical protein